MDQNEQKQTFDLNGFSNLYGCKMNRTKSLSPLLLILASLLLTVSSCQKIDLGEDSESISNGADGTVTINASMTKSDIWTVNTLSVKSKATTTMEKVYQYYCFDSKGVALFNNGRYANEENISLNYPLTFTQIDSVGTYTFRGILNIAAAEYISIKKAGHVITTDSLITIQEPRDICLGSQQLKVTADKIDYDVKVTVSHIMAKLALTIKNVPPVITSLNVTLPKESNMFSFKGEFKDSTQSQQLTIVKASQTNTDGTYDWSVLDGSDTEEIIYPCILKTMPITVTASDGTKTYTFNTRSSVVCTSGTRTSLSTSWSTITSTDAAMTVNTWTGTQQTGSFDLGTAVISSN